MWHPIRLAEDYAMADIVTDGRVVIGHQPRLPHPRARELRRPADRRQEPRAVRGRRADAEVFRQPNPPGGEPSTAPVSTRLPPEGHRHGAGRSTSHRSGCRSRNAGIELMAKYGLKAMVTLNGEKTSTTWCAPPRRLPQAPAAEAARRGHDLGHGIPRRRRDRGDAKASSPPTTSPLVDRAVRVRPVLPTAQPDLSWPSPRACRSLRRSRSPKAWFCSPPRQVIEGIRSIEAKYPGLENFMIHWAEGLERRIKQLSWFAKDVMPAFCRSGSGRCIPARLALISAPTWTETTTWRRRYGSA